MLASLKRKLVIAMVTLVGLVLTGVLVSSLITVYTSYQRAIDQALDWAMDSPLDNSQIVGGAVEGDQRLGSGMLVMGVEVASDGVVLQTSKLPQSMDAGTPDQVIGEALSSGTNQGYLSDAQIAWKSKDLGDSGGKRIVMVNTSDVHSAWRYQAIRNGIAFALALGAVIIIAFSFADWALIPVRQSMEQQRRFVGDASHELKTPLAVIIANTEILQRSPDVPQRERRWIESTAQESHFMRELIGELLQLERTDEGIDGAEFAFRHDDIDLSELVESSALEFDAVAFEKGCVIDLTSTDGIHVRGDAEWLGRVVRIFLDNACKYAAPNTTIAVTLAPQHHHRASVVQLSVTNRGTPIPPEDLPHIFDRFYRADASRTKGDGPGGFGLGLSIAKGIVEAHGGTAGATSTREQGTTFTVRLPTI